MSTQEEQPTQFVAGRPARPDLTAEEEAFLARAPAAVAFPYGRVLAERSPVQKLVHLFVSYANLVRWTAVLGLARVLEEPGGAEEASAELRGLSQAELPAWVALLARLARRVPAEEALGRALSGVVETLETGRQVRLREIVDMKVKESTVGFMTNLARFQQAQPRNLADLDEGALERSFRFGSRCYQEMLAALAPLWAFRAVHCSEVEGRLEVRELVGDREHFPPLAREAPGGLAAGRVAVERPDGPPLDLHPLAVFHECYDCYKENPKRETREFFLYQGHSGRRIYYQGTRHRIATQELVGAFQARLESARARPEAVVEEPSDVQELLDRRARQAVRRAQALGRYRSDLHVSRKEAEHRVLVHLARRGRPVLLVSGPCGSGKSTLLDHLADRLPRAGHLVLPVDARGEAIEPAALLERAAGAPMPAILARAAGILGPERRLVVLVDHADRSPSRDLLEGLVQLAAGWERDHPWLRWVIAVRPEHLELVQLASGARVLGSPALATTAVEELDGPAESPVYRLPPLDAAEQAALYEAALKTDAYQAATPLHALKRSAQRLVETPDLLLVALNAYRHREVPSAATVERVFERYKKKRVDAVPEREPFLAGVLHAMVEKRAEAVSSDDLIDVGEEALRKELLGAGSSPLVEALVKDGVLARVSSGEGMFSESVLSFAHPTVFGFLLAERLLAEKPDPWKVELATLSREPPGRNVAAEPLFHLLGRKAGSRDFQFVRDLVAKGGPVLRPVLARLLWVEELQRGGQGERPEPIGPLAAALLDTTEGAHAALELARELFRRGEHDRVQAVLEKLAASPAADQLPVEYYQGRASLAAGDAKSAAKHLKRAEKRLRDPSPERDFQITLATAEALAATGQGAKAEAAAGRLFDRLQVAGAQELLVPCRLLMARMAAAGEKPQEAQGLFERALETALQANRPAWEREVRLHFARWLEGRGDLEGAARERIRLAEVAAAGGDRAAEAVELLELARLGAGGPAVRAERVARALALVEPLGPSMGLARAALALGGVEEEAGRVERALACFERAVETGRLYKDEPFLAAAWNRLGAARHAWGDYQGALDGYSKSFELRKRAQDREGLAASYHNIGLLFRVMGDGQKALDYFAKSVELKEQLQDKAGLAKTRAQMAVLLAARGDLAEAQGALDWARTTFEALGDKPGQAACLWSDGLIAEQQGDVERAFSAWQACGRLQEETGDRRGLAATFNQLALVHKWRGDEHGALKLFEQAAAIQEQLGDRRGLSATYNNLGVIHDARGEFDQALAYYEKDLKLTEALGDQAGVATSFNNLAIAHYNHRNFVRALYYLEKALEVHKKLGDQAAVRATEEKIGRVKARM